MSGSVWVKVHPDYAGGGNGTLDPAELLSDPVAVISANPVQSYTVKLTDGTSKKIWFLPGNPTSREESIYSVELSQGTLPGVMVASGGPGGYTNQGVFTAVGAGGAGGVIGQGSFTPVVLPEEATYTFTVGGTSTSGDENTIYLYGQNTTIAVQGGTGFATAIGGGGGLSYRGGQYVQPHQGASGGGGSIGSASGSVNPYWAGAPGTPGQGNKGGMCVYNFAGGGGGYSAPGEGLVAPYPSSTGGSGGAGFNLKDALSLDDNDVSTLTFINDVSDGGFIAGGGSSHTSPAIHGGGSGTGGHAMSYTGGGGGGGSGLGTNGGCGMVLLVTEV